MTPRGPRAPPAGGDSGLYIAVPSVQGGDDMNDREGRSRHTKLTAEAVPSVPAPRAVFNGGPGPALIGGPSALFVLRLDGLVFVGVANRCGDDSSFSVPEL